MAGEAQPLLRVSVMHTDEVAVVSLDGELDLATAGAVDRQLRDLLADASLRRVVLDAEALAFVDATGIAPLIRTAEAMRARGGDLVVRQPNRLLRRLLEILGLDERLARR